MVGLSNEVNFYEFCNWNCFYRCCLCKWIQRFEVADWSDTQIWTEGIKNFVISCWKSQIHQNSVWAFEKLCESFSKLKRSRCLASSEQKLQLQIKINFHRCLLRFYLVIPLEVIKIAKSFVPRKKSFAIKGLCMNQHFLPSKRKKNLLLMSPCSLSLKSFLFPFAKCHEMLMLAMPKKLAFPEKLRFVSFVLEIHSKIPSSGFICFY